MSALHGASTGLEAGAQGAHLEAPTLPGAGRGPHGAGAKGKGGTSTHGSPRRPRLPCRDLGGDFPVGRASRAEGLQLPIPRRTWGRWTALGNSAHLSGLLGPCAWPVSNPQKEQRKSHLSFKPEVEIPPEEDPCLHNDRVTCAASQLSSHPARLGRSSAQRPESCPPVAQGGLHWTGQQVQVAGMEAPWSNGDILRNHVLS